MKHLLHFTLLLLWASGPATSSAQAPNLGVTAGFALFSANGAISNSGISQITGKVGTNNGSSTAFGNVNGTMHDGDSVSAQAGADLIIAYNQLNSAIPGFFPAPLLGNGQTLTAGVYAITGAATLNNELILNAQGNANAVFIFQIQGAFASNAGARITLLNGALACNVYWKIEGQVGLSSGTKMKGTILANNAAISLSTGDSLEGRAFTTSGAITVDGVHISLPLGCGSPVLTGPLAPDLGTAACYAIFSANGDLVNSGISAITGDVGSNTSAPAGFDPSTITGFLHAVPDLSTAQCAIDLGVAYNYLNTLDYDIELLYPAQFGSNLVLTPHTYRMNAAAILTDSLYLDAQGNTNAVFVIQINGALTTGTYAKVLLINGASAENVYWKVEGAVSINNYSVFNGTIVCNNGALGALNTGVVLNGRALTTNGALNTTAMTATAPVPQAFCAAVGMEDLDAGLPETCLFPNPFSANLTVKLENASFSNRYEVCLYTINGTILSRTVISAAEISVNTEMFPAGMYIYRIFDGHLAVRQGKIVKL